MDTSIQGLARWGALLVFGVPVLGMLPVKLLALYLFGTAHPLLGVVVLAGAKVLGTALTARLFHLTQPALMQYRWFARFYPRWKAWKDGLILWIRASGLWRRTRALKAQAKAWWYA